MRRHRAQCHIDLWDDLALVVSPLGHVQAHAHACSAFVFGLEREFHIGHRGAWTRTTGVWIPAGYTHRLECGDQLMAMIYPMGPPYGAEERLRSMAPEWLEALRDGLRPTATESIARPAVHRLLQTTLSSADRRILEPARIDHRVLKTLRAVRRAPEQAQSIDELAESVGLSGSRLMQLFKKELGIPYRKVRNWERLRHVVVQRASGENLTMASLSAGYTDSSHLSRAFKDMFGISASTVLHRSARIRVSDAI